jgi:hypothetical protein
MLVGEADAGQDVTLESDIESNFFGPDQLSDVVAKYKSGPLVDAFRGAVSPSTDPELVGSIGGAILVKTNVGVKASGALPKIGGGTYATLADKSYGKIGNLIAYQTTSAQAESAPTTGLFTWIPPVGVVTYAVRLNGGLPLGTTIAASATPSAAVTTFGGLAGLVSAGGTSRGTLASFASRSVSGALNGTNGLILTATNFSWDVTPSVGDTVMIPASAPANIAGASQQNVGCYVVTASTTTTITMTKLSDAGKVTPSPVAGVITAPVAIVTTALAAVTDIVAYAPISISAVASTVVDGLGKTLEIVELAGADLLSRCAFALSTSPVSWVSKTGAPQIVSAAAEYKVTLADSRAIDSVSESLTVGGEVALKLSYLTTNAVTTSTVTISATQLTTTVTGGTGAALTLSLADFPTIQALADFINAQTGYVCAVGNGALGTLPPSALDRVTAVGIGSNWGAGNCRIKIDAYRLFSAISASNLLQLGTTTVARAGAGLPDVMAAQSFLTGGSRGGTSDTSVVAGLAALENARGNFVVPLFSRDATSDISDGLTDSTSTYTLTGVTTAVKNHCIAVSNVKRARNRQGIVSIASTFALSQALAQNIAFFRNNVVIQDDRWTDSAGNPVQFLPWMTATKAAAMQAIGFYRSIEGKTINTSGLVSRVGDFNSRSDGQVDAACLAGLMVARPVPNGGGWAWVSDQTSYGKTGDTGGFVFNSLQAVYNADLVSVDAAQKLQAAFVGQSTADISASLGRTYMEGLLANYLRQKLLSVSDDAPKGYKSLSVKIVGNVMVISVEIKLSSTLDYIVLNFAITQVTQSA